MHEPFARQQQQLMLRRRRIDMREYYAMEGEVPRGVPGIFPFVGHRDDVVVVEMAPDRVAAGFARSRRRHRIAVEPACDVVVLLAPYHPSERLPHYRCLLVTRVARSKRCIILLSFAATIGMDLLEASAEVGSFAGKVACQANPQFDGLARGDREVIPASHFRAAARRIYRRSAMDDVVVDAIFGVWRLLIGAGVEVPGIGFVLAEQQRWPFAGWIRTGNESPPAEQFFLRNRANDVASVAGDRANLSRRIHLERPRFR